MLKKPAQRNASKGSAFSISIEAPHAMDLLPLHSWVRTNLCREMFQIATQAESLGTVHSCGQQNGRCEFKVLRIGFFMPSLGVVILMILN